MKTSTSSETTSAFDPIARYICFVCAAIIVLLPFHAFLTVWGASLVGHYTALRLWKEILLAVLFVAAVIVAVRQRPEWNAAKKIFGPTWLCGLIKLYGAACVLAGLIAYAAGGVSLRALAYGLILDLRFLLFFGIVWLASAHGQGWIGRHWRALLLVPAVGVMVFGLLQFTVLPADFLRHFGYGPTTIQAVETIDQKAAYPRVQSTLRGANPLGAYLVLIVSAFGALLLPLARPATKKRKYSQWYAAGFVAACVVLAFTFSRSAWIGAAAALGWLLYESFRLAPGRLRRNILVAAAAVLVAFAVVGYGLRNNDIFQNTFFHTDEHSQSAASSNTGHFRATATGVRDVAAHPLGSGVGTAGPASVYNTGHQPKIAENYFVQVGQETGIVGAVLFGTIVFMLARELWLRREHVLAQVLLASLLGLTLINILSHGWTDDTISYIWWGFAGSVMVLSGIKPKVRHEA
jgi:hypothetical protein